MRAQTSVQRIHRSEPVLCIQMSNITVTYRDGRVAQLEQVYIRGSKIRFLILPDMLKNAPMLKSMKNKNQGSGAGRGKAAILKAQGEWGGGGLLSARICLLIILKIQVSMVTEQGVCSGPSGC